MAEGGALLRRYTAYTRIEGSNPSLSAIIRSSIAPGGVPAAPDPRLDMPSTRIILRTIAKQGKIPEDLVKDVDGWVGKYVDYSYLDKAEASLNK